MTSALLAHQGGWDEILLVGAPLLLFLGMLFVARRRAEALNAARDAEGGEAEDQERG